MIGNLSLFLIVCKIGENLAAMRCDPLTKKNYDTTDLCRDKCCENTNCNVWEFREDGCWHGSGNVNCVEAANSTKKVIILEGEIFGS